MPSLPVHLITQWGDTANRWSRDCGVACVAMCLDYYAKLGTWTVDRLAAETPLASGASGLAPANLAVLAGRHGLKTSVRREVTEAMLKAQIDQGRPVIILLAYRFILGRLDQNDNKPGWDGHFVVLTGYDDDHFVLNDPDHWAPYQTFGHDYPVPVRELAPAMAEYQGQCVFMEEDVSTKAQIINLAKEIQALAEQLTEAPTVNTVTVYVISANGANVRSTAAVRSDNKVGGLPYRAAISVREGATMADGQPWYNIVGGKYDGCWIAGLVVSTEAPK